ncbi:EamA family transporter RarD [uncultured Amnibacterium sp.]|uniref:EamA family transporter RarD n=1 Tax=uncultured Amnibacterium sp. TaxID=1631851 RepID=UPI0035CC9D6F
MTDGAADGVGDRSGDPAVRRRSGLIAGFGAYLLWGAMPVYFLAMRAGAVEIVGARILSSLIFCGLLVLLLRRGSALRRVLRDRRTVLTLGLAGVLIYVNWQVYVAATTSDHVTDAALGYFINPIVTVLLGVIVLRERLRPGQWAAVGISLLAVVVLTAEARAVPWISLVLAASFALYGLVKNRVGSTVDPLSGLVFETAWLAPVAVVQLVIVGVGGGLTWGTSGLLPTLLLTTAGIGTAIPLLLFAASTNRLPLTVVGFLQYLTPILQLGLGVLVLQEPMPPARLIGFSIVWLALIVLVVESLVAGGRIRRSARPPVTDG